MASTQPVRDSEEIAPSTRTTMASTQPVPDSEEIAPSTRTTMASTQPVPGSEEIAPFTRTTMASTQPVPHSEEIAPSTRTTMASTSCSIGNTFQPLLGYDVFINHCGIDVKHSLASTIYHTLGLIGVRAFMDEELEEGDGTSPKIRAAIWSASVHIAIFSPNYAQSRRCLEELTMMFQTGKKIIPIFYHVKPSHLAQSEKCSSSPDRGDEKRSMGPDGSEPYSEAFSKHEKDGRCTPQNLEEWKMALSKASEISGCEVNERQKDQGLLVKNIVNNVKEEMRDCGKYKVVINGSDVENTLASAIYHTLGFMGVRAFLHREELKAGEEIPHSIKQAISDASVHIAIFSPNYAKSRWCLDELSLMLETGKKIITIFYHVNPSHLQSVALAQGSGDYCKAFSEHEGRYEPQRLQKWTRALYQASLISGYEVNENDEGLVVRKIVNYVKKEMKQRELLHVATHPVGLDEAIEEFQSFLKTCFTETESRQTDEAMEELLSFTERESRQTDIQVFTRNFREYATRQNVKSLKIVGIAGLGGCGKTTLVKEYFNRKRFSYTRSSFLSDVRDAAAEHRLHDLQRKLLEDLVDIRGLAIRHPDEGKGALEHWVRYVKALIVLDDVDHIDQMEALLPSNLQRDSLIIVTTRDSRVIESSASLSRIVSVSVYKKRGLDPLHATQLFCWHAFSRESVVKGYEDLVKQILTACQGLPLSLKVLGAQLCGNNNWDYWESVIHKISKILPNDIKHRLKVSYDALDEEQQQKFVDIACSFIGKEKDTVISIWDGPDWDGSFWSGLQSFQILENKCLVELDKENRIKMHHHLLDLGREIGRKIVVEKPPSLSCSHSQFLNSKRPPSS